MFNVRRALRLWLCTNDDVSAKTSKQGKLSVANDVEERRYSSRRGLAGRGSQHRNKPSYRILDISRAQTKLDLLHICCSY